MHFELDGQRTFTYQLSPGAEGLHGSHYEVYLEFLHQHRESLSCIMRAGNVPPKANRETGYKTVDEPVAVLLKETP